MQGVSVLGVALIFGGAVLFMTAFVLLVQEFIRKLADRKRVRRHKEEQHRARIALDIWEGCEVDSFGGFGFLPVISTRTFFYDPWNPFREHTLDNASEDEYRYLIIWREPSRNEVKVAACSSLPARGEEPREQLMDHLGETFELKRQGRTATYRSNFEDIEETQWCWYENEAGTRHLFFYQIGREWVGRYGVNVPLKNLRMRYPSL